MGVRLARGRLYDAALLATIGKLVEERLAAA